MYHIHQLNKISPKGTELLTEEYTNTESMDEAEGVLVRSANMHEMHFSENLLAVARAGAGVNNIPLTSCADQGIVVFNTPGANANSVMELAIGGINWVQSIKGSPDIAKMVEKGKSRFAGNELRGKKLGIIGLGAIGGPLANRSRKLGMDVYGCDPHISVEAAWNLDRHIQKVNEREEIFRTCDIITMHVPLLPATKHMINAETLAMMKPGAILLNTARGGLIDEEAVAEALKCGHLAWYGADVVSREPIAADNPLLSAPNCFLSPHIAWAPTQTRQRLHQIAAENLRAFLAGKPQNVVNP